MKTIVLTFCLLLSLASKSQSIDTLRYCGSDEMRIQFLSENPIIKEAVIKRENQLNRFTKNFEHNFNISKQNHYIIPVVFHVIHNYGSENISDAQIKDGLRVLNNYFNKNSADSSQVINAFKPLIADCQIEFRLAKKDPNGNCTKGINRIPSLLTSIGDHQVKKIIHWPPHQYLNVYVVANAAGLAGHCIWPSDADTIPQWDGIVIAHNYVGSIGTSTSTTQVTLSHEVGHYLNLHHTWGGNNVPGYYFLPCANPNKDCAIDDEVADTPTTIGWQTCNLNGASCGSSLDNVQNMMEYSYCNRMFTPGQKMRMHACLNDTIANRNNLWSANNLIATGTADTNHLLCAADFYYSNTNICNGKSITYTNASYNANIDSVKWYFNGGTPAFSTLNNPVITYNTPGRYDVKLIAYSGTDSVIKQSNHLVFVTPANAQPNLLFYEDFENFTNLNDSNYTCTSYDTIANWQITNQSSYSGTQSLMINNYENIIKNKTEIISPAINLIGQNGAGISFKYAFTQRKTSNNDKLTLMVSRDCGTSWVPRWNKQGLALSTADSSNLPFIPNNTQWSEALISNLPSIFYTDGFRFKLSFESDGGNNIYIDDLNINYLTSQQKINYSSFKIYPQPASELLNITNLFPFTYEIFNSLGQIIYTNNLKNSYHQINTKPLKNGIYFIRLSIENEFKVQKFIVEH